MFIIKRNGQKEEINLNKIRNCIRQFCHNLNSEYIDVDSITSTVSQGLVNGIRSMELNTLLAETCASMITYHYDYGLLAARFAISNLHKETRANFSEVIQQLHENSVVSKRIANVVANNAAHLDSSIVHSRDYAFNYFGFKTLEKSYLLRINDIVVERPQYLFMRVALEIHNDDIPRVLESYNLMSQKYFIHATPTLFNAGTLNPQLSSCFLLTMKCEDIESIFETVTQCAVISRYAGGIGLAAHGTENLIPMLHVLNSTSRFIQERGCKRPGAFAIYLEPWHMSIFEFLNLKKNTGTIESHCRDLFTALWIPDLFMQRVENDSIWSLMNPVECVGLSNCYGKKFNLLYETYERENKFTKQVPARKVFRAILEAQIESGTPYMLYKDSCNQKSNQSNLGTIQCSNLCSEIVQFVSPKEIAVCNLASIALNQFVSNGHFDFEKLKEITKVVTYNLNKIIDINMYPVVQAKTSNLLHRPIAIGVQGLADTFFLLKYAFDSPEARDLNVKIFETLYYGALEASNELSHTCGPYISFPNSPASNGILQYDLWEEAELPVGPWNWNSLKKKIQKRGLRNSLLIAVMPTASTAQIFDNFESCDPITSNIYTRNVLSGNYQIINKYLLHDLIDLNLWSNAMKERIIANQGSVQHIDEIPNSLKLLYKTAWEISQKCLIDMAVKRGPFVDQSQSLTIYLENPTISKLSSMHFYGWRKGLKTGMYYLRTKGAASPIQFTVSKDCVNCSA